MFIWGLISAAIFGKRGSFIDVSRLAEKAPANGLSDFVAAAAAVAVKLKRGAAAAAGFEPALKLKVGSDAPEPNLKLGTAIPAEGLAPLPNFEADSAVVVTLPALKLKETLLPAVVVLLNTDDEDNNAPPAKDGIDDCDEKGLGAPPAKEGAEGFDGRNVLGAASADDDCDENKLEAPPAKEGNDGCWDDKTGYGDDATAVAPTNDPTKGRDVEELEEPANVSTGSCCAAKRLALDDIAPPWGVAADSLMVEVEGSVEALLVVEGGTANEMPAFNKGRASTEEAEDREGAAKEGAVKDGSVPRLTPGR